MRLVALIAACVACVVVDGCACGAPAGTLNACIEVEHGDVRDFAGISSGEGVVQGRPVSDDGFPTRNGTCKAADAITIDSGTDFGRVRFSWESDAVHLDVPLADGVVTVDHIEESFFGGAFSFVITDARGLAVGVSGSGIDKAGPLTFTQGSWRGEGVTGCGTYSTTSMRVSDGTTTTEVELGDEKVVRAGAVDVSVHAFDSTHLDSWHCTDSSGTFTWALGRVDGRAPSL